MIILRGKHKGKHARLHQFANDWISADLLPDNHPIIVSPTGVQLEGDEITEMRAHTSVGSFWSEYSFDASTQRFVKRPR